MSQHDACVAKLVPFSAEGASDEELFLVAAGKMRLSKSVSIADLVKIRAGKVAGSEGIQALLDEREETL